MKSFTLICLTVLLAQAVYAAPPNVIYILADDLGYGDLGSYGQKKFKTPNLDSLAAQGMRFTRHYSGSTVCAPSRCSLLTGYHSGHAYVRGNAEVFPEGQAAMPADTYTVAHLFKEAGYRTGVFGKWGLGSPGSASDPLKMGFDRFYGYNCQRQAHHYYPYFLWNNDRREILWNNFGTERGDYAPDLIQDRILSFVEENKDRPFFLYYALIQPHAEMFAREETMDQFRGRFLPESRYKGVDDGPGFRKGPYGSQPEAHAAFAAMVHDLDHDVGELMDLLESLGIADNTLVIFSSDNGPHREGGHDPEYFDSAGGLRGYKRDLYEGGIRVPMIASWPGNIHPGTVSDHLSAFWDFLPTMAELTEVDLSTELDGISFLPTLLGKGEQEHHPFLYWEFHEKGGRMALRKGKWKAVRYNVAKDPRSPVELYDLESDPFEEVNLAPRHPEVAREMDILLRNARTQSPVEKFNFPKGRQYAADGSAPEKKNRGHSGKAGDRSPDEEVLAAKPPMGWNSFDSYGVYLHEEAAIANIKAMAQKLKKAGYEYFVIDNGWFGEYALQKGSLLPAEKHAHDVRINEYGYFLPSKVYFPNGIRHLADLCHDLGLKFGVHLMRGIPRKAYQMDLPIEGTPYTARDIADTNPERNCQWCTYCYGVDMSKPGAQEWYDGLIQHIADMGVDFIKYDDIVPYPDEIEAVAEAIRKTGRPIVLSLSPGNTVDPNDIASFKRANMLRVTEDVWDEQKYIDRCFEAWRKWQGKEAPGFWIDMDMIPFGQLQLMSPEDDEGGVNDVALAGKGRNRWCQLSTDQMETFITLRAMAASPLMMGGDLPTLDSDSLALITNKEMLACNQNGVMGSLLESGNGLEIWRTPEQDSQDSGWVGIFNRNDAGSIGFRVELERLGVPFNARLHDIWKERRILPGDYRLIPANGVLFLKYD